MGFVDTQTVCPFPFIWPSALNFSSNAGDCTQTFAQRLGTGHDIFQAVLLTVSLSTFFIACRRMYLLKQYTLRKRVSLVEFPTFPYFVAYISFTFFFSLESFDVFAFRGWYPPHLYFILDEFVASSLISIAVVLVDFWVRCARGIGKGKFGLRKNEKHLLICAIFFNFVGWIVVGVIDSERYNLYEACKSFGGAGLVFFFLTRSGRAVYELHKTLTGTSSSAGVHGTNDTNNALSSPLSLPANTAESTPPAAVQQVSKRNAKAIRVLVRKYVQFSFIVILGGMVLLVNGFINLGFDSGFQWQWTVRFEDQYDATQIVLRSVYLLGALMGLTFFQIPTDNSAQAARKPSTFSGSQPHSKAEPRTSVLGLVGSSLKALVGGRPGMTSNRPLMMGAGGRDADSMPEMDNHRPQQLMVVDGSNIFQSTIQADNGTFQLSDEDSAPGVFVDGVFESDMPTSRG